MKRELIPVGEAEMEKRLADELLQIRLYTSRGDE